MKLADIIVIIAIVALLALALWLGRRRRRGGGCCSGGCDSCGQCPKCRENSKGTKD